MIEPIGKARGTNPTKGAYYSQEARRVNAPRSILRDHRLSHVAWQRMEDVHQLRRHRIHAGQAVDGIQHAMRLIMRQQRIR